MSVFFGRTYLKHWDKSDFNYYVLHFLGTEKAITFSKE
jgi:hypothetical protein